MIEAVRGVTWGLAAQAAQVAAQFVATFFLARELTAGEWGAAGLALALVGVVAAASDLGMGVLVVRHARPDLRRAALLSFAAGAMTCGLLSLAGAVAGAPLLRVAAGLLLFAGLASTPRACLQRALAFRTLAAIDIAVAVLAAGSRILLARHGQGARSIILGDLAAAVAGTLLLWWFAPRPGRGSGGPSAGDGVRIVGARAADYAFQQADRLWIGAGLGPVALGIYAFAWQHAMFLGQRMAPLAEQVALPVLARLQNDRAALGRAYLALTRLNAAILIPFSLLLWVLAPQVVGWIYPGRWSEAVPALRALCIASAAAALNSHPGLVWLALGRIRLRLFWSAANLPVMAAVLAAGAPFGVVGVAYALAARSLVAAVVAQEITRRVAGISHGDYWRALMQRTRG